jgi:hypothetical protein
MPMSIGSGDTLVFIASVIRQKWGKRRFRRFISDLAVNRRISASTQTVALSALLFLYRDVLKAQRREDDDDLYARVESRQERCA